jgi:hypothetical protein
VASAPASKQALHARVQLRELVEGGRPGVPLPSGAFRHDVGCVPAVGDDPVDPLRRTDVLAEQSDGHLGHGERVRGVDAELRIGGRVRRHPGEAHVEVLDRQARHPGRLEGRWVDHHREVRAVEAAGAQHQDLAAPTLLGGGTEDPDREAELVGQRCQGQPGTDGGRRDDVVAARVPDPRQGVVLGADRHRQGPGAGLRDDRGVEPRRPVLDVEPSRGQCLGHPARGVVLLESQLGVGVDRVGQRDQGVTGAVDLVLDGGEVVVHDLLRFWGGGAGGCSAARVALHPMRAAARPPRATSELRRLQPTLRGLRPTREPRAPTLRLRRA